MRSERKKKKKERKRSDVSVNDLASLEVGHGERLRHGGGRVLDLPRVHVQRAVQHLTAFHT